MAFSYQAPHHPFDLLDSSVYLPRTPVVETLLIPHQAAGDHLSTTTAAASSSSCFTTTTTFPYSSSDTHLLRSPITVPKKEINCMKKKRKSGDEESRITGEYSKDGKDTSTKQKGAKRKANDEDKKASNEACSDPTGGYIHVRARRGQATDSHSLAERVRREKISERMKMLQGLVPGCEKVTGKALMLDEIINYVQSLQNQVEFLSMRIASLSPVLYDFNVDLDDCINQHQKMLRSNMPQALPSLDQANKAFDNGQANYQVMEYSPFQVVQGPTAFSQVDGGSGLHDAQRLGFIDQLGFINMCSFQ